MPWPALTVDQRYDTVREVQRDADHSDWFTALDG